jgi:hypothetical protein
MDPTQFQGSKGKGGLVRYLLIAALVVFVLRAAVPSLFDALSEVASDMAGMVR